MDLNCKYLYCRYFCDIKKECSKKSVLFNGYCQYHQKYSNDINYFNDKYYNYYSSFLSELLFNMEISHSSFERMKKINSIFYFLTIHSRIIIDNTILQQIVYKKFIEIINEAKKNNYLFQKKFIKKFQKLFPLNKLYPNINYEKINIEKLINNKNISKDFVFKKNIKKIVIII